MKKINVILTMVAMTGMLALTGCGVTVSTGKTDIPLKAVNETVEAQTSETMTTPATEMPAEVAEEDFVAGAAQVTEAETPAAEEVPETTESYATETVAAAPESTDWAAALDPGKDWMFILSGEEELAYCFELTTDETDYLTYGTLVCQGSNGTYWEYKTGKHELGQNYTIELLYEAEKCLYVNDGGTVVKIDARDGRVIWRNADYQGGGSTVTMDDDGNLYVAGYEYPALIIIDQSGNTKLFVEQFADYYWTSVLVIEDNFLNIYYDGREGTKVQMDLRDYSYMVY